MQGLLFKNYLLKRRNLRSTIAELAFPVYFGIILAVIAITGNSSTSVTQEDFSSALPVPQWSRVCQDPYLGLHDTPCSLGYVRGNNFIDRFVNSTQARAPGLQLIAFDTVVELRNAMLANITYTNPGKESNIFGGLFFDDSSATISMVGPNLISRTNLPIALMSGVMHYDGTQSYRFMARDANTVSTVPTTKRILWPAYFPFILFFALVSTVVGLVSEKSKKLKTLMVLCTSEAAYLFSWFVTQFIISAVGIIFLLVILFATGAIAVVGIGYLIAAFLLFALSLISVAFFLSHFFENSRNAAGVTSLYLLVSCALTFVLTMLIFPNVPNLALARFLGVLFSLMSPMTAFGLLVQSLGTSDDFGAPVSLTDGTFPLIISYMMLVVDAVLYFFLGWFLGVGRRNGWRNVLCFCCQQRRAPHRRSGKSLQRKYSRERLLDEVLSSGVELVGVTKKFDHVCAVDDLSVVFRAGGINVLLGENGSGKSTTIAMLIGDERPTSGEIYGIERRNMGICFQANALFEKLTVREHLDLFLRMKGMRVEEGLLMQKAAEVGLGESLNQASEKLSGGQKRKLCLAIAMLGDPRFLLADECSAGIDQASAIQIWAILRNFCERNDGSTILITTHEMMEAEALGSQIVILKKGRLRAQGSVEALTAKFNIGYRISFAPHAEAEQVVKQLFGVDPVALRTGDIEFSIGQYSEKFRALFERLDALHVTYGFTSGSLREVFLRVCDEELEN